MEQKKVVGSISMDDLISKISNLELGDHFFITLFHQEKNSLETLCSFAKANPSEIVFLLDNLSDQMMAISKICLENLKQARANEPPADKGSLH